ncbi:OsmC family protein [Agrobacterium pusense]|uniref:OsmC family protein n=1 Tax=Agrobacterium pusense TaxID=648995 RepID=UPI00156B13AD|nr:OsmC family protein [Agrobacterium pusense]QKJ93677.1 OsmC family protein [Agrobacterium pusense]
MLEYRISARRIDPRESVARSGSAQVRLATGLTGPVDAFNPAELLLASVAACMIKGIERVLPLLDFSLDGIEGMLHAVRQDDPPRIVCIDYELVVDTEESDQRLELLHKNVRKYGTISNTVALATRLDGVIRRAS